MKLHIKEDDSNASKLTVTIDLPEEMSDAIYSMYDNVDTYEIEDVLDGVVALKPYGIEVDETTVTLTNVPKSKVRYVQDLVTDYLNSIWEDILENGQLYNDGKDTNDNDDDVSVPQKVLTKGPFTLREASGKLYIKHCDKDAAGTVSIPSGVVWADSNAFDSCINITTIKLPDSFDTETVRINYAFDGCTGLQNIIFPSTIHTLNVELFAGTGISNIVIPKQITQIGSYALSSDTAKTITIQNKQALNNWLHNAANDLVRRFSHLGGIMAKERQYFETGLPHPDVLVNGTPLRKLLKQFAAEDVD